MAKEKAAAPAGEVFLRDVRLSFADIFKPGKDQKNDKGEIVPGKFKSNFLMEKGTPATDKNLKAIKAVAAKVKQEKWGDNQPKLKPEKVCLRDGDGEDWDGYEGVFYLSANNTRQPTLSGLNPKGPAVKESDGLLYSGCRVNAIVRLWAQDNQHGKRLNASLEAIQFFQHGEPFGSKPVNAEEAFEDLSNSMEADDLNIGSNDDEDDDLI